MYDPLIINPTMTLGGKQAAFAASNAGMSLKLTHVRFGKGVYDPTGTETALKTPVGSKITLAGGTRPTQYQIRMLAAWREDLGGETPVTEIGYYADNVLAFIWSDKSGEPAFIKTDGVPAVLFSDIAFDSVPAGSIDITIDPAESVALAALSAHEAASNAHPQYVEHALFPDAQADMWMTVTGSANALVLKPPTDVRVPAYKVGQAFRFKAAYSSTGAVTANVNSLGVKSVVKAGGTALMPGDLRVGAIYDLIYDGTRFQLAGGVGGGQFYIEYPTVATANQTVFNGAYTPGSEFVFVNGVKLAKTEYTATDGSKITLKTGVAAGTLVTLVALSTFAVADTYSKGEYDSFAATALQAKDKASTVINRWMSPQRTHEAIMARTQATPYDTTADALLVPGSFGAGALTLAAVASLNALTAGGTYGWGATSTGAPVADYGEVQHLPGDTSAFATQIITSHYANRMWLRRKTNNTWQAPVEIYHSGNQLALGTTAAAGRSALGLGAAALLAKSDALYNALVGSTNEAATTAQLVGLRDRTTPIVNGGTGATTKDEALANLGGQPLSALLTAYVTNNGYGLGTVTLANVDDLNTLNTTGIYRYASNGLNTPLSGQSGSVLHMAYSGTYQVQVCFHLGQGGTYNNQFFMRSMNSSKWGEWVQFARTDSPTFTGTPTAPTAPLNTNTTQIATMAALLEAINATGFGRYSIVLGAVSIDTLDSNGSYFTSTTTTGTFPDGYSSINGAVVLHEQGAVGSAKQTLTHRDANRTWVRNKASSVWKPWREVAFTDSPAFLGIPTAPTADEGVKTKQIATMEALFAATKGRGLGASNDLRNTIYAIGTPTDILGTGLTMGLADASTLGIPGLTAVSTWGVLHVEGGWSNASSAITSLSREFHYLDRRFVQKAASATAWGTWGELATAGDNTSINSLSDVTFKGANVLTGTLSSNRVDTTLVPGSGYRSSGNMVVPKLRLSDNAAGPGCTMALQAYSYSTFDFGATIVGTRSAGGMGAHAQLPVDRVTLSLIGAASDGTQYQQNSRIDFYTAEAIKPDSAAGEIRILTTPVGGLVPTAAATFGSDGTFTAYGQGVFKKGAAVSGTLSATGDLVTNFRQGVIRNGGVPYATYVRSDLTDTPEVNTQVMLVQAKGASPNSNFDGGKILAALAAYYTTSGGGSALLSARDTTTAVGAEIYLDGDQRLTSVRAGDFQVNNAFIAAGVATFNKLATFVLGAVFSAAVRINAKLSLSSDNASPAVDRTNAGIYLTNNLNNGDGGITVENYAPAFTFVDRTVNTKNMRLRADGGYLRLDVDDGAYNWSNNLAQFGPTGHLSLGGSGGSNARLLTVGNNVAGNGNLTGTTQMGVMCYQNIGADATVRGIGVGVESTIGDGVATWTCPDWVDFWSNSNTVNAGTTVTLATSYRAFDYSNVAVKTAYAFDGRQMTRAGVNRWNLYMQGSAPNYLRGTTIIGGTDTTVDASLALDVNGNADVSGTLGVSGAASFKGNANVGADLGVTGGASVNKNLAVGGDAWITGGVAVTGTATIDKTLAVGGNATLYGQLAVSGGAEVGGTLSVAGAVRSAQYMDIGYQNAVAGVRQMSFYSGGKTTITATIAVTGSAPGSSTMALTANKVTLSNDAEVSGHLQVNRSCGIAGPFSAASAVIAGNLDAVGYVAAANGAASLSRTVIGMRCMTPDNSENLHFFAYNNNGTERSLMYSDTAGAWHFRHYGSVESLVLNANGNASVGGGLSVGSYLTASGYGYVAGNLGSGADINAAGNIVGGNLYARGVLYCGDSASWLATNGNVYGPVWGGYLSTYLSANFTQRGAIGSDYANYAGGTGNIGTYALMTNRSGANLSPGSLVNGASLTYANTEDASRNGGSPGVGTWRCMGTASPNQNDQGTTLFLRIS